MIPQYGGHTDRCGHRFKDFRKEALYILSREQCCIKSCFLSRTSSFDKAVTIISEARMEIHNLDRGAKKNHIRDLVTNCIKGDSVKHAPTMIWLCLGSTDAERLDVLWKKRTRNNLMVENICRRAFCIAYDIGTTTLSQICDEIKVLLKYFHLKFKPYILGQYSCNCSCVFG